METNQYKRWDAKEEAVIIRHLKETLNKKAAFTRSAVELDRSVASVASHWYIKMKNDPKYTAVFVTISNNLVLNNGSRPTLNTREIQVNKTLGAKLKQILKAVFKIR